MGQNQGYGFQPPPPNMLNQGHMGNPGSPSPGPDPGMGLQAFLTGLYHGIMLHPSMQGGPGTPPPSNIRQDAMNPSPPPQPWSKPGMPPNVPTNGPY